MDDRGRRWAGPLAAAALPQRRALARLAQGATLVLAAVMLAAVMVGVALTVSLGGGPVNAMS